MSIVQGAVTGKSLAELVSGKSKENNNDKGSIGNRLEYATKQTFGLRRMMIKDELALTAGVAGSAGAAALVSKSKTAQNFITKGFETVKNSNFGKEAVKLTKSVAESAAPYVKQGASWIQALPKPAKAVLGAGLAITALVCNSITNKGVYDAGKLDQEYTDKAKLQNIL